MTKMLRRGSMLQIATRIHFKEGMVQLAWWFNWPHSPLPVIFVPFPINYMSLEWHKISKMDFNLYFIFIHCCEKFPCCEAEWLLGIPDPSNLHIVIYIIPGPILNNDALVDMAKSLLRNFSMLSGLNLTSITLTIDYQKFPCSLMLYPLEIGSERASKVRLKTTYGRAQGFIGWNRPHFCRGWGGEKIIYMKTVFPLFGTVLAQQKGRMRHRPASKMHSFQQPGWWEGLSCASCAQLLEVQESTVWKAVGMFLIYRWEEASWEVDSGVESDPCGDEKEACVGASGEQATGQQSSAGDLSSLGCWQLSCSM